MRAASQPAPMIRAFARRPVSPTKRVPQGVEAPCPENIRPVRAISAADADAFESDRFPGKARATLRTRTLRAFGRSRHSSGLIS